MSRPKNNSMHIILLAVLINFLAVATELHAANIDLSYGGSGKDGLRTIETLDDGGFILAGWREQQKPGHVGIGYIICINADGSVRWDKDIVTNGENRVSNVIENNNGNLTLVVEEYPITTDPGQAVLMELSANGEILKQRPIGGPGPDLIEVMRSTPDGGYIFGGESASSIDGDYQSWIGKLSKDFELEWEHRIGKPDSPDVFQDITLLPDGSVIGVGMLNENSTNEQKPAKPWAARISVAGELIWSKIIEQQELFALRGSVSLADGKIALTGYSRNWDTKEYNSWVGVMSSQGEIIWSQTIANPGYDQLIALEPANDGELIAVGFIKSAQSDFDLYLVKFSSDDKKVIPYTHQKTGSQFGRAVRALKNGTVAAGGFDTQSNSSNGQQLWFLNLQIPDPQ